MIQDLSPTEGGVSSAVGSLGTSDLAFADDRDRARPLDLALAAGLVSSFPLPEERERVEALGGLTGVPASRGLTRLDLSPLGLGPGWSAEATPAPAAGSSEPWCDSGEATRRPPSAAGGPWRRREGRRLHHLPQWLRGASQSLGVRLRADATKLDPSWRAIEDEVHICHPGAACSRAWRSKRYVG